MIVMLLHTTTHAHMSMTCTRANTRQTNRIKHR